MAIEDNISRYLRSCRYHTAIPEVVSVFHRLGKLPAAIRRIPLEAREEKAAYDALTHHLAQAIKAADRIGKKLPAVPELGLDTHAIERSWASRLKTIHDSAKLKTPQLASGRPANKGEEKLALAVWGALHRAKVPKHRIAAVTTGCLHRMGIPDETLERAIRSARKLAKPLLK